MAQSEARVILLYCSKEEAQRIFSAAEDLQITGKDYVWVATKSVLNDDTTAFSPPEFPPGMLVVYFNSSLQNLLDEIERAVSVFGYGMEAFINDPKNADVSLSPNLNCNASGDNTWTKGGQFFE